MAAITSTSASVSASSTTTIPTSVESDNPLTFQLTNVQDIFDKIDHAPGDSLTVTKVSSNYFTEIQHEREKREKEGRRFRFRDYDSNSRILIITILTSLHETLHRPLYDEFIGQIRDMGLKKSWRDIGSARRSAQQGQSGKEGDSAGGPNPQRATKGAWPTLVIEAGFSQTLEKLRLVMQRWFSISNHEVKIVLAKFDGTTILLEKWEEEMPVRPGATATRYSLQHRQSITITQNATTNPISYNVTRGALVLSFRLLFLRDPGPDEGDLVFSVQELEEYAEAVWAQV
ncbi:hypothetical protein B0T24DRAFT_544694 [Lasiosphaeria ovina]|uniref:Uncharacterized protein n=1 Tax=Lasiosphaeria ovina TaxID=92902 RepID=A0AAE0NMY2_9PEZI|nr:hypothetical protein B0T24DRAFT_544694 [Lasiosphaeria ovina]